MKATNVKNHPIRVQDANNKNVLVQPGGDVELNELVSGFREVEVKSSSKSRKTTIEESE